jgi:hypothetical protein
MTPRHDTLWQSAESKTMDATERPLLEQQVADLAALKAISEFRQSLPRGSAEWVRALREEDGLIERIVASAGQRPTDSRRRR